MGHFGDYQNEIYLAGLKGHQPRFLPLDQIRRPRALLVGDRGLESTPANRAAQAHGAHQPPHRATRHRDLFAVHLTPGLAGPVHAEVLVPNPLNMG